jgi:hypothetical protein
MEHAALPEQLIDQGGFPMINMGDDRNVSNFVCMHWLAQQVVAYSRQYPDEKRRCNYPWRPGKSKGKVAVRAAAGLSQG